MRCEHCGTIFCWDDADTTMLGNGTKRFCSKKCTKNAKNKRGARPSQRNSPSKRSAWKNYRAKKACEERPKPSFGSEDEALDEISRLQRVPPLYAYSCRCGFWHLTSQPQQEGALA